MFFVTSQNFLISFGKIKDGIKYGVNGKNHDIFITCSLSILCPTCEKGDEIPLGVSLLKRESR